MITSASSHPARALRAIAVLVWFSLLGSVFATPVAFDIPAQPAAAALQLFGRQAGVEVLFPAGELKQVKSAAVKGDLEPLAAITQLLAGTGYAAEQTGPHNFVVTRVVPKTASIKGTLLGEGGKGLADVLVALRGTALSVTTNSYGEYFFSEVEAGAYVLVATSPGYLPLHIVDVNVKAGRDLTLGKEELRKPLGSVTVLDPIVVHADATTELEKIEVTGTKQKPFEGANMDLPRTVNDAQPYYIFDSKVIAQAGATNVEDFLKSRLTMNTTAQTNGQTSGQNNAGNTSSINLRGLGADKTLILINGRRAAGVGIASDVTGTFSTGQPDLNGIPLSAIDRIEVLPASASGIYGGGAMGGVVNVILKKDYTGGEIRTTYDNSFDTDSARRTVAASYGWAMEGGKTRVMLNASWSDANALLLQDRRGIFEQSRATMAANDPLFLQTSSSVPYMGSLPNIVNGTSRVNLILKSGGTIGSPRTYVPAGTSSTTPTATLSAALKANAGQWNFDSPPSTQAVAGLLRPYGTKPETKAFMASVSRQMLPNIEMFADFSYNSNRTATVYNSLNYLAVPANSVINPFTTRVIIATPTASQVPMVTDSSARTLTLGTVVRLPAGWTGEFDYTWSQSRFSYTNYYTDTTATTADLQTGVLNPFVDTLLYPLNLDKYRAQSGADSVNTLRDFSLRGSGPLPALPWGVPTLTVGLEHRQQQTPEVTQANLYPITTSDNFSTTYFARDQVTDSAYAEATLPLVKPDALPLVHAFELQLSGRAERYTVDTGTEGYSLAGSDPTRTYFGATDNGAPFFTKTRYTSTNGTAGLKYQPVPDITVRTSVATAFLPPSPSDLVKSKDVIPEGDFVDGNPVDTISGGNPNLKPQNSKSWNAGIIWAPSKGALTGLRLNAEYYKITQRNAIAVLTAQQIVDAGSVFADRVTRDASGTVTQVDVSAVNLFKRETEGWDLSADYTRKTGFGTFTLGGTESIILHLKNQYLPATPDYDAVGFPSEAGAAKYKANVRLGWEWRGWTAGWTANYYGAYWQNGAAGGPRSVQNYDGAAYPLYITRQGGDTIPAQTYHDLYLGYAFSRRASAAGAGLRRLGDSLLEGLTLQLGVRNVFDKVAPLDAYYVSNYYRSPYGDLRLRSYWLSLKKAF